MTKEVSLDKFCFKILHVWFSNSDQNGFIGRSLSGFWFLHPYVVSTAMSDDALSNQYIGLIIGVLAAVILLLVLIIFVIIMRNRRRKQNNNHTVLKPVEKRVTINMKVDNHTWQLFLSSPCCSSCSFTLFTPSLVPLPPPPPPSPFLKRWNVHVRFNVHNHSFFKNH